MAIHHLRLTAGAWMQVQGEQLLILRGMGSHAAPHLVEDPLACVVLEHFLHESDVDRVFADCREDRRPWVLGGAELQTLSSVDRASHSLRMGRGRLSLNDDRTWARTDLTRHSSATKRVVTTFAARCFRQPLAPTALTRDTFDRTVSTLVEVGALGPLVGTVNWGELRRNVPTCSMYGFSRGTPIDRYYLNRFVASAEPCVRGKTVEFGGMPDSQASYRFTSSSEYLISDVMPAPHVDVVGDAHDPALFENGSLDTVIAFNVLEHCRAPWIIADNFRRWLQPGGSALIMVPCVQRVHRLPHDYWRPMPDGLASLFAQFADVQTFTYGNLIATTAALHGIAAEELSAEELDASHPDYPVAACVLART